MYNCFIRIRLQTRSDGDPTSFLGLWTWENTKNLSSTIDGVKCRANQQIHSFFLPHLGTFAVAETCLVVDIMAMQLLLPRP